MARYADARFSVLVRALETLIRFAM
jgi:hypothetical protein